MTPDLTRYDVILVNSSAGKDSQAMLDHLVELVDEARLPRSRLVVVHADLGRVEWKGTRALAERQARHYGLRFEVVARDRDLLHQVEHERGLWPSSAARYCTSDQKTGQVRKLLTQLAAERKHLGRPVRILNCLGMRAQESPARAKKAVFEVEKAATGKGTVKVVHRWLPIHAWTEDQVWERIRQSGVEHHPAYDLGMPRLSCCFCVLSTKSALVLAARHNPELADEYVAVELRIGHRFQEKLSMAEVVAEARSTDTDGPVENWSA